MTKGEVAGDKEMARKLIAHTKSSREKQMQVDSQQDLSNDIRIQDPGRFL